MRFALQLHKKNIGNTKYNKAIDSFELNIGISLY